MNKYLAYVTAEECAEVTQEIMKSLRFGLYQTSPKDGKTNKEKLEQEIGQLKYCLDRFIRENNLDKQAIIEAYDDKLLSWNKWKAY